MNRFLSTLTIAVALGLSGCGTAAIDFPLSGPPNMDRRSIETTADGAFIILAFSGGGSRAAALAASVTAQLDSITYDTPRGTRRLSDDIAVVSSVSGGSLYSTYMALNGPSREKATDFEKHIQDFDGFGYLSKRFLNPVTWVNLQLENTTRIDVLKEMMDDFLKPQNATLTVLNQPNKPIFLLNASDMVAGHVFTFDPKTVDDLCMNYEAMPLTLATTASAAFPGAFTPVLLRNDSYPQGPGSEGCTVPHLPTVNISTTLRNSGGSYGNLESFRYLRYRDLLRAGENSFRRPQYVRLVDGGVVDNLGLTSVRMGLLDPQSPFNLQKFMRTRSLTRLVVMVVNARSDKKSDLDASAKYTTLTDILGSVSGVLVDSASAGAASTFDGFILNLASERNELVEAGVPGARFNIYPVTIDFDQLPSATPEERDFMTSVKSIDTNWTLKPGDVNLIDRAADQLLWRHPCFRDLVTSLHAPLNPNIPPVTAVCTSPALPAMR